MPNDDLGQFPSPARSLGEGGATPSGSAPPPMDQPPVMAPLPATPAFEETPDEIPTFSAPEPTPITPEPVVIETPVYQTPEEAPATVVPRGGSAFGSFIGILLLLIAGVAIALAVFLFSQSKQLKLQIQEITQTLEKQKTTVTPTPTPTIIDLPDLTPTPEASPSATPTPTPSPTSSTTSALPLASAAKALKVGINHLPNAQLILIKTENATDLINASTKYFFRQDLSTKKYFYVLITGNAEPEIVDKSIYVTPDNNIPSLNDMVLGSTLGIDLDLAITLANDLCLSKLCKTAVVKAQYIKSGENPIWQLSFDPADTTKEDLTIQINTLTKEVLYKSPGF